MYWCLRVFVCSCSLPFPHLHASVILIPPFTMFFQEFVCTVVVVCVELFDEIFLLIVPHAFHNLYYSTFIYNPIPIFIHILIIHPFQTQQNIFKDRNLPFNANLQHPLQHDPSHPTHPDHPENPANTTNSPKASIGMPKDPSLDLRTSAGMYSLSGCSYFT